MAPPMRWARWSTASPSSTSIAEHGRCRSTCAGSTAPCTPMWGTRSRSAAGISTCTRVPAPSCARKSCWDGSFPPTCASVVREAWRARASRSSTVTSPWVEFSERATGDATVDRMPGTLERALEAGLRIRPGEQRRVVLMSLYAANAIGAVVVGRSVRDALYLANRPARGLAGMYIWSSAAIVLVSWLYARVADRVPRGRLNAARALGCAAAAAAFWAMLELTDAVWVYAGLYVFVEAMGSLVVIQFWTLANDVFHAREAKRLFGLIGAGGTLANVVFACWWDGTRRSSERKICCCWSSRSSRSARCSRRPARSCRPRPR